jgi:hypothetical protein
MMAETREHREWKLQNRFGPIVGISELSDEDFDRLEQGAHEYERHRIEWCAKINAALTPADKE